MALDSFNDDLVWIQSGGTIAERRVRIGHWGMNRGPDADVTYTIRGNRYSLLSTLIAVEYRTPPAKVKGVTNAIAVTWMRYLWAPDSAFNSPPGLPISASDLQVSNVRLALLADGGMAMWNSPEGPRVLSGQAIRSILRGNTVRGFVGEGRILLSDGSVEDGVFERIAQFIAGNKRPIEGFPDPARLKPLDFKYTLRGVPAPCIKKIAGELVLLTNGDVHRYTLPTEPGSVLGGGILKPEPWLTGVRDVAVGMKGRAWFALKNDGTVVWTLLPAESARQAQPPPAPLLVEGAKGITKIFASYADVWMLARDGTTSVASLGIGELPSQFYPGDVRLHDVRGQPAIRGVTDLWLESSLFSKYTIGLALDQSLWLWPSGYSDIALWSPEVAEESRVIRIDDDVSSIKAMTLVDPVAAKSLLEGSKVSADPAVLGDLTRGRVVDGVAADGVSQVVVRVPTAAAGQWVTLRLTSEDCIVDTSGGCASQKLPEGEYGGFGVPGRAPTDVVSSSIRVQAKATPGESATGTAFAVYRAPGDFTRRLSSAGGRTDTDKTCPPGYDPSDCGASSRDVWVSVEYEGATPAGSSGPKRRVAPLRIVRPPVVLIHGFSSDSCSWNQFNPLVSGDSVFPNIRLDYSSRIQVRRTSPDYGELPEGVSQNVMGVQWNSEHLLQRLVSSIDTFKTGRPVAADETCAQADAPPFRVAAVQADVVGHSMGGLIAKAIQRHPEYLAPGNFGQGYFHKLITLGTPHLGSPWPKKSLSEAFRASVATWLLNALARWADRAYFWVEPTGHAPTNGAFVDLIGEGTTVSVTRLNRVLDRLHKPPCAGPELPMALVAAAVEAPGATRDAQIDTPLFGIEDHDGVVSVPSALDGQPMGSPGTFVGRGIVHSSSIAALLGVERHLQNQSEVASLVMRLMHTSRRETNRFRIVKADRSLCADSVIARQVPPLDKLRERAYLTMTPPWEAKWGNLGLAWQRTGWQFDAFRNRTIRAYKDEMQQAAERQDPVLAYQVALKYMVPIISFSYPEGWSRLAVIAEQSGVFDQVEAIAQGFAAGVATEKLAPNTLRRTADGVDSLASAYNDWYVRNLGRSVNLDSLDDASRHRRLHSMVGSGRTLAGTLRSVATALEQGAQVAGVVGRYKDVYDNSKALFGFTYAASTSTESYRAEASSFVLDIAQDFADMAVRSGYPSRDWSDLAMLIVDEFDALREAAAAARKK